MRLFTGILLFLCASISHAQLTFSLASSSGDLSYLQINDTVTIQVNVSGAAVGQEFDSLAAVVTWDAGRFGLPQVFPGALVPNNPVDFLAFEDSETADVAFFTFSTDPADHVVADADTFTFFSFDVTAVGAGVGSFQLGAVGATEFNPLEPTSPTILAATTDESLAFLIAVPEPSCFTLATAAAMFFVVRRLRR